jgi:hypothetical protein
MERPMDLNSAEAVLDSARPVDGAGQQRASFSNWPTLVVGAGGTGVKVLTFLKALLLTRLGPEFAASRIRLLAFDTAQEPFSVRVGEDVVTLEPGSELFLIGRVPVPNIRHNLHRLDAIRERLGTALANLPPVIMRSRGAKQIRPLGLLSFYWHFPLVEDQLRTALWALARRDDTEGPAGLLQGEGINSYVISSLIGGTGSAVYLDTAYLIRDLLDELGGLDDSSQVVSVGVLPQAFPGVRGPNLLPNTLATLKELNHCMTGGGFYARYPNGRVIDSVAAPFDRCYLVDGVDASGRTWAGHSEVCAMIAQALYLLMGSPIGRKTEGDLQNLIDEALAGQTPGGEGTFLGSFGLAAYVFRGDEAAAVCARRHAARLITEGWLRPADGQEARVSGATLGERLLPDGLDAMLAVDDQGMPITVQLDVPAFLERLPIHEVPSAARRYVHTYAKARLDGQFRGWMEARRAERMAEAERLLRQWVVATAQATERGVPFALLALQVLQQRLADGVEMLAAQHADLTGQVEAQEQDLQPLEETLMHAPDTFPVGRAHRVATARDRYFQVAQALYHKRLQVLLVEARLRFVADVNDAAATLSRTLETVSAKLRSAAQMLEQQAPVAGRATGVAQLSLADSAYLDRLYGDCAPALSETSAALFPPESNESLLDWSGHAPAEVIRRLLAAVDGPFDPIRHITVEDAIAHRAAEASPQARREKLVELAAASWNVDATRLPDGGARLVRLAVLGVPDENHTLYADRSSMLVSTHDPGQVILFQAVLGAPYTALQVVEDCARAYDRARGARPLHILPALQTGEENIRLAFALGGILGFIFNRGTWFYYRPSDHLADEVQLGNGMDSAIRAFGRREELVHRAMERVESAIAREGVERILERLAGYYADDSGDPLMRSLQRLVREYADELRRVYQFTRGAGAPRLREVR